MRFFSVSVQTLITPVITASLYLLVFGLSLGSRIDLFPDLTYIQFVVPGLILMGVVNNSFANTSSSIFFSRYIGNIVDLLVTPLTPAQFIFAYTIAALLRGLLVGLAVYIVSIFFTGLPWTNPLMALVMIVLSGFLFAQFGIVAAMYSNTFDNISMYTNFLILPLIYTGGLFYPVSHLPPFWQKVSHLNPLTYLIDGFRQSVVGFGDTPLLVNFGVALGFSVFFFAWAWKIIYSGNRLRT
ncbi:MAG: ABC transporter permease [Oligoflexia bacterium]|nr:ABC transporter permease [Oligoflexia bacterium]